jgi:hypothetical protein
MSDDLQLEALRAAFTAAEEAPAAVAEADLDAIQRAVEGELGADERQVLFERLSVEPGLATAWRLALELRNGLASGVAHPIRRSWISRYRIPLAAAAAVLVTVGGLWLRAPSQPLVGAPSQPLVGAPSQPLVGAPSQPVVRALPLPALVSSLAEGAALPRERFELVWRSPFDGASFDVDVLDTELRVLFRARGLSESRVIVPAEDLAHLPAGSEVLWRVEAHSLGGEVSASLTFVQRVE